MPGDPPLPAGGGRHWGLVHAAGLAHRKPPPDRLPEAGREVVTTFVTKLAYYSVIKVAQKLFVASQLTLLILRSHDVTAGCY